MVKYAYASINEMGKVNGGKAGDQTGREVKKANEYNFGQTHVVRVVDKAKRVKVGDTAKKIAENDSIGYSQTSRNGLFTQCQAGKWAIDVAKVKPCNTDCSSMGVVCINMAFKKEVMPSYTCSRDFVAFAKKFLGKKVKILDYKKGMTLYKGDVVLKNGHVVTVYKGGTARV